ncbi:MAG: hypothetical protein KDB01_08400 [Planctomycetaceae bacterium]|nr:hypothetical protein [Planctomycetaceae bacterium]
MTDHSKPLNDRANHRTITVIQHIARNRLTTIDVLHRAVFPRLSRNAVAKMVTRLCGQGELAKYTLRHPALYFVLGERGARSAGLALYRTRPLGPQALQVEYAVLLHAMFSRPPRIRLTAQEVMAQYPWLPKKLGHAIHCHEHGTDILELIRVDLGGAVDHVARKCATDINARRTSPEFLAMVAECRFRLVVATGTPEKAASLRRALKNHNLPQGLRVHFSVVPELHYFSMRTKHA